MIITKDTDLLAQIDELRADVQTLRDQLSTGVGVPAYQSAADGDVLVVVTGYPAWGTLPVPVTAINVTSPITSTGGTTPTIGHANSGVAAGSYTNVDLTVDARGHITAASNGTGGSAAWGSITGTLSSQTDLQSALNGKGGLATLNTWLYEQTYGSTSTYRQVVQTTYNVSSTPASTTTWYRLATLPHLDYGQEATIYARFHRAGGNGEAFYKFIIGKATYDGVVGTTFRYEMLGRFNAAYGISSARIVEAAAPNNPSYLDVQMMTTDAFTMNVLANTVCAGVASATALGWVSQGTGAAGSVIGVSGNLSVEGNTVQGVYRYTNTAGVSVFTNIALPGTTSEYVRGDGSRATLPASGSGTVTSVAKGNGMDFVSFSTSGTITLGTPGTCNASSTNNVATNSHTHAIAGFLPLTGGTLTGTLSGTTIQGTTIRETSDARFKSSVHFLRDGIDIIRDLLPVRFHNDLTDEHEIGLIAQDVRAVLPEVVSTDDNGDLAVAYQRIVAPLIDAVQTLDRQLRITQFALAAAALVVAIIVAAVML